MENMKRVLLKTSLLVLFSLFAAPPAVLGQGSIYKFGDRVQIARNDTVSGQLMTAAEWVEVSGRIANDLFSAGRQITIDGTVGDDAFLFGESVIVRGEVGDMLLGAGETIHIDGVIQGDVFATGRRIRITENARFSGNVSLAGESIHLEGGAVDGWIRIAGRSIDLNAPVGLYGVIYSSDVRFGTDYSAPGGTRIVSHQPMPREGLGAIPDGLEIDVRETPAFPVLFFQVWFYLSVLATGLVLLFMFQNTAADLHRFSTERFWRHTGVGFLSFFGIPLLMVMFIVPLITIPLAIMTGVLYGLALFISYLLVALILGVHLLQWFRKEPARSTYYWGLVVGLILLALVINAPFIGFIANILLLFFGLGSLMAFAWHRYRTAQQS